MCNKYPFVHQIASKSSKKFKLLYFFIFALYLSLLIAASIIEHFFANPTAVFICFLFSAASILTLKFFNFKASWKESRSIAERIKSITWKWISKAPPYNNKDAEDKDSFEKDINNILENHKKLLSCSAGSSNIIFTDYMKNNRALPFTKRLELYKTERITNQIEWYKEKASCFKNRNIIALIIFSILIASTIFIMIYGISTNQLFTTSELLTTASAITAWLESCHYEELRQSYLFTHHKISIISNKTINNVTDFETLVEEVESIFAEEHGKWLLHNKN